MKLLLRLFLALSLLVSLVVACDPSNDPANASSLRLSFSTNAVKLGVGEVAQLQVVPTDGNGVSYTGVFVVQWASSAPSVLSVSPGGTITGLSNGVATVTATATRLDTNATASASATVIVGLGAPDGGSTDAGSTDAGSPDAAPDGGVVPGRIAAYAFSAGSGSLVADGSGNANHGTLTPGGTWVAGVHGGGLAFNGSAGYVSVGDVNAMDGLSRLTVSSWVKTSDSAERHVADKSLCDGLTNGGPFEFGTGVFNPGRATLIVYRAGGAPDFAYVESASSVADGAWHHIAGVYDGTNLSMYVDGVLSGSKSAPGYTLSSTANAFQIGGHCNGSAYVWNGALDDVRVYSRALTGSDIQADMAVGAPDASSSPDAGVPDAGANDAGAVGYLLDFSTAVLENPLSAGGVWTNNTQGTGGNGAPGNLTSMMVGLASNGTTRIAFDTRNTSPLNQAYDDSFAFVPGFPGDQWAEAVVYRDPAYAPTGNHELELILGCSSAVGTRAWNEFTFADTGSITWAYLDGGPSDYTILPGGANPGPLANGDVLRATKVGNTIQAYKNGALMLQYQGPFVANGSGIGIAAFARPGTTHNMLGFRSVRMGKL